MNSPRLTRSDDDGSPVPIRPISRPRVLFRSTPLTPIIGRDREIAQILSLLARDEVRLVTLTGAGGIGKTRLATEIAGLSSNQFVDGVAFLPMAALRDPELVVATIAQAVGVREYPDQSTVERLCTSLADASMLLVLDNLEQVPAATPYIAELLEGCADLKILATSRGALRIPGEREIALSSLPVVAPGRAASIETIGNLPSVQLFVDRAAAARPGFALTEANATAVQAICNRLDGLPLAIELAAMRSKLLSPAAILSRLENRLSFLTSGAATQPVRLQTLRNAIVWSYDLLSAREQRLFRRLAVFTGGFTLAAAEAMHINGEQLVDDVLDGVTALVDKGLIVVDDQTAIDAAEPRFRMLETIREFAHEQLDASGELSAVRDAHAAYVLEMTERAEGTYLRGENAPWLAQLSAEQDNIRAALSWFIAQQHADGALRLSAAAIWLWFIRGQFEEGRNWYQTILSAGWANVSTVPRCRALFGAGMLAHYQGDAQTVQTVLDECEALSRTLGDDISLARALLLQGVAAEDAGRYAEAKPRIAESSAIFERLGDTLWTAQSLVHEGVVAFGQGDFDLASERCEAGLRAYQRVGRKLGAAVGIASALDILSLIALRRSDLMTAQELQRESLLLRVDLEDQRGIASGIGGVAVIAVATNAYVPAARLFGAADALRETLGIVLAHPESDIYEESIQTIRRNLTSDVFDDAWRAGRTMSLEEILDLCNSIIATDQPASGAAPGLPKHGDTDRLTAREREVLRLITNGMSDKEIANALFISPRTAMRHVANVFAKIGVHSRGAAGAYARRQGLVD